MKQLLHFSAIVLTILAAALAATAALADEGANFSLQAVELESPSAAYFTFEATAGALVGGKIKVTNNGGAPGVVRLYAVDAATAHTSGAVYLMQDDPRQAAGAWIDLPLAELTLSPGESQIIPFTVTVPAGAPVGQHLGGIIAEAAAGTEAAQTATTDGAAAFQVTIRSRSALAVLVNLPGDAVEKIEASGISAGGQDGRQQLFIAMRNSGNQIVKPSGELTVKDGRGQEVQRLSFRMDTFLPWTEIEYPVYVENEALKAGTYQADLTMQYGAEAKVEQYQLYFRITEAQNVQVFSGREALKAPAIQLAVPAASSDESSLWRATIMGGLVALNVALLGLLVYLVHQYYQQRKLRQARARRPTLPPQPVRQTNVARRPTAVNSQ